MTVFILAVTVRDKIVQEPAAYLLKWNKSNRLTYISACRFALTLPEERV